MSVRAVPFAFAIALSGCRVFDAGLVSTDADATPDAVEMPDTGRPPACALTLPPERPDLPRTEDSGSIVLVVQGWTIDQRDDRWRTIGYDLDGLCTQPPELEVECVPPAASSIPEVDGEGGIDNALGHNLFDLFLSFFPNLDEEINEAAETGLGGVVFIVREWNGTADDSRVDVVVTQSALASSALPDGGAPPPEMADRSPRWDGTDWFWVRSDTFVGGDLERPLFRRDDAYVTGGMLVVFIPDRLPITFSGQETGLRVTLTGGVATIPMPLRDLDGAGATFAGRFPITDFLDTIQNAGFCAGSADYVRFERLLDLAADVRADPGTGGPGVHCNAISVGMRSNRYTGNIAGISSRLGYPNACADGGAPTDAGSEDAGTADDGGDPDAGT